MNIQKFKDALAQEIPLAMYALTKEELEYFVALQSAHQKLLEAAKKFSNWDSCGHYEDCTYMIEEDEDHPETCDCGTYERKIEFEQAIKESSEGV